MRVTVHISGAEIGALLSLAGSTRKLRVVAYDKESGIATLEEEPTETIVIQRLSYPDYRIPIPPRSRFLPGDPKPWKRRGKNGR
jgi:hypothetical protein